MQDNLDREKKVRADVEKAKRKLEQDLRQTQEAVEELERVKSELEDAGRKSVRLINKLHDFIKMQLVSNLSLTFRNRCCLPRNDCPPDVVATDSK